jgi:hypothetical protein
VKIPIFPQSQPLLCTYSVRSPTEPTHTVRLFGEPINRYTYSTLPPRLLMT